MTVGSIHCGGPIEFDWDALDRTASALWGAADELSSLPGAARAASERLVEAFSPELEVRFEAGLLQEQLEAASTIARDLVEDACHLARSVARAREQYAQAEEDVSAVVTEAVLLADGEIPAGEVPRAQASGPVDSGDQQGDVTEAASSARPVDPAAFDAARDLIEPFLGSLEIRPDELISDWLDSLTEKSPFLGFILSPLSRALEALADGARRAGALEAGGLLSYGVGKIFEVAGVRARQRPVRVAGSARGAVRRRPAGSTARFLHGGLEAVKRRASEAEGQGRSSVLVERVDKPQDGGPPVLVAYLPGSADLGDLWSNNPNGVIGLGDALYGDSLAMRSGVQEALEQAGYMPGMRVVLAGHSQGGMHAVNLASDPHFVDAYGISAVFTEGSPVGAARIDPRVDALHLENAGDPVPALDGAPNEETERRSSVTMQRSTGVGLLGEHALDSYGESAAGVDAAASGRDVRARLGRMLGDVSESRVFELAQEVDGEPPHTTWEWGIGHPDSGAGWDWDEGLTHLLSPQETPASIRRAAGR